MYAKFLLGVAVTIALIAILFPSHDAGAAPLRVFTPSQGGTGIGSATVGNVGNCIKVLDDSPFTYELGICGAGGGGGGLGWATTTGNFIMYNTLGSQALVLSANNRTSTGTTAYLNTYGGISSDYFTATSSVLTNTFPLLLTTNATATNLFATLGLFTNASTTFASSTSLTVGQNLRVLSLADGCLNSTSGLIGSTGSACGAGGGGGSNWLYNGSRLSPSTTVGIGVFASSTIGGGTGATGLSILGNATTTGTIISLGTATSTFASPISLGNNHLQAAGLKAFGSGGLDLHSSNGSIVSNFGAGAGTNATFYGGVNIDGTTRLATTLNGLLLGTAGTVSAATNGTNYTLIGSTTCSGTDKVSKITADGIITCSADLSGGGGAGLSTSTAIADTYVIYGTSAGTVGAEAAFNYDDATNILTVDSGLLTHATATNLGATNVNFFGGGQKTTANAFCIQLTGSSDLCDGSDGGGGGASNWDQSILAGVLSPSTTIGIRVAASSTFLGALTVASTTPDYLNPIFKVATSSNSVGNLFEVMATTSQLTHNSTWQYPQDSGLRMAIGDDTYYRAQQLDNIMFSGTVRNRDWNQTECANPAWATALAADGFTGCPGIIFAEGSGTNSTLSNVAGNGYAYATLATAVAAEGADVGLGVGTALTFGSSTPIMEVTARIGSIVTGASTTGHFIGFHNDSFSVPDSTAPTQGCFFAASSTQANWRAICRTGLGVATNIDTGFASTSIVSGNGIWRKFRIEGDSSSVKFYMTNDNYELVQVADISTNVPTTQLGGQLLIQTVSNTVTQLSFMNLEFAWRKFIPKI